MVASCDGLLRIIDLGTGTQMRAATLGGNFAGAPAYAAGAAYVGGLEGKYYAVRLSDAAVLWQHEEQTRTSGIYASAAVMGDAVIFASRSNNVFRVNRGTGNVEWSFATRSDVDSSPVINGSHVLFGSSDGNIYRIALSNGQQVWSFNAGAAISASPAVGQRRLVVGAADGAVYCFG